MGFLTSSTDFVLRDHTWALAYALFFAVGAFLFGWDQSYFTGIEAMVPFINKYGDVTSSTGVMSFSSLMLSILTSIIQVGDLIGCWIAGFVLQIFGRRGGLILSSLVVCVAVTLQAAAPNVGCMIAGRVLLGVGVGLLSNAVPLYLSELAPRQIKGIVVGWWQFTLAFAGLIVSIINQGTQYIDGSASFLIPIILQLICPTIFLTGIWFIPESPRVLLLQDKIKEAEAALRKINRSNVNYEPTADINEYILDIQAEQEAPKGSWLELITNSVERRKVICCCGIFMSQQLTGSTFITTYCTVFAKDLQIANPFTINVIHSVAAVSGVLFNWTIVERFNRKTLLLVTTTILICLMFIIGGLASGPQQAPLVPTAPFGKSIIGLILIFTFTFDCAWGPLTWAVATDMAVGRNRTKIMALGTSTFWIFSWLVTFTLPYMMAVIGAKIGFVYGGGCCISFLFTWLVIGETRGRTLEEIDEMFMNHVSARKFLSYKPLVHEQALATAAKLDGEEKTIMPMTDSVNKV